MGDYLFIYFFLLSPRGGCFSGLSLSLILLPQLWWLVGVVLFRCPGLGAHCEFRSQWWRLRFHWPVRAKGTSSEGVCHKAVHLLILEPGDGGSTATLTYIENESQIIQAWKLKSNSPNRTHAGSYLLTSTQELWHACTHAHLSPSLPSLSYTHVMMIVHKIIIINTCRWSDIIPETYVKILGTRNKGDTVLITMATRWRAVPSAGKEEQGHRYSIIDAFEYGLKIPKGLQMWTPGFLPW